MVRQFALVVLDVRDTVVKRFNLDLVDKPKGLGFSLNINTIETDIEEIAVSLKQKLKPITFDVNYAYGREYVRAKSLRMWIEENTNDRMAIEWTTPADRLYADCKVEEFQFSEITQAKVMSIPLNIKVLSPFFEVVSGAITIFPSTTGKQYPFTYPYTYGMGIVKNNEITNNYIRPIPLTVTLYGEMTNVQVSITEKGKEAAYAQVMFSGLTLLPKREENGQVIPAQYVTIKASKPQRIIFFDGYTERDGYDYINQSYQSYIFAKESATSFLSAYGVQSDKSGYVEASYRRYRL